MRRNIIRYVLLSYCMATRAVSFRVKKRFPDLQHLVDAGLMREDEYKVSKHKIFFSLNTNSFHFIVCKYFTNFRGGTQEFELRSIFLFQKKHNFA